jgi:hypothetical protein
MSDLTRLSVNLNEETTAALHEIANARGITYTEAVRRCILVAKYIEDSTAEGRQVITQRPDGTHARELVLL